MPATRLIRQAKVLTRIEAQKPRARMKQAGSEGAGARGGEADDQTIWKRLRRNRRRWYCGLMLHRQAVIETCGACGGCGIARVRVMEVDMCVWDA